MSNDFDALARTMLGRIAELLRARPDLSRGDIGAAIDRGGPWVSEFLNGIRTTNDLRLVAQLATLFGVPIGYLLGEKETVPDGALLTLRAAWPHLSERDRSVVLSLAVSLRGRTVPSTVAGRGGPKSAPRAAVASTSL